MKIEFNVEHLHELERLIAVLDKHRVGAVILLVAVLAVPSLAFGAYYLLK